MASLVNRDRIMSPDTKMEDNNNISAFKSKRIRSDLNLIKSTRASFLSDLYNFHTSRNTPITRFPKINGHELDLQKLYSEVTFRGGLAKVNIRNEWCEIVKKFNVSPNCVNASVAFKHIYIRFLDKYERQHFLGEDPDKPDEPDDDGRGRRKSFLPSLLSTSQSAAVSSINFIPMSYNEKQHQVSENNRLLHKLSTDLYKSSEYERLIMALTSPLPNEQDFAINVCLLMSNEAKHILKVENCPKLLDFLMAHTGVYYHYSVRELFNEFYTNVRKHSLQSFWDDLLKGNQEILELSYDDFLSDTSYFQSISDIGSEEIPSNEELIRKFFSKENMSRAKNSTTFRMQSEPCPLKKNNNYISSLDLSLVDQDTDFLQLGRGLGTQDFVGQRILQVISIIRNLSFFDENLTVLAKNKTLIRFLIMASNIRWGSIHQQALDILGNIAPEIELQDPATDTLTRCIASTVSEGLLGSDRGFIINCLEILYKLCQFEKNKYYVYKCIQQNIYDQISLYLTLNDIMLLLYTLECIYSLTALGQRTCNQIIHVKGIVPTLVSLITVEAQTYGPGGCISMRVVETVPGSMINTVTKNIQNIANLQNVGMQMQTPGPHVRKIIQSPGPQGSPQPAATNDTKSVLLTSTPEQQEIEQFTISWLNNNFETVDSIQSRIEVKELYKMYIAANQKLSRPSGISPKQLPNLLKIIFGPKIGPNIIKRTDANNIETTNTYYVNIKLKVTPIGGQIKTQIPASPVSLQTQSPLVSTTISTPVLNNHKVSTDSPDPSKDKKIIRKAKILENAKENDISNKLLHAVEESRKLPTQSVIITKTQLPQPPQQTQKVIGNVVISHTPNAQPQTTTTSDVNSQITSTTTTINNITTTTSQQQPQVLQNSSSFTSTTSTTSPLSSSITTTTATTTSSSSSLIKSLLANKVTTTMSPTATSTPQLTNCVTTTTTIKSINPPTANATTKLELLPTNSTSTIQIQNNNNNSCNSTINTDTNSSSTNLHHQVAQRQQKQKEIIQHPPVTQYNNSSMKLTTSISQIVSNSLLQSAPVKVGQTTIKPINPHGPLMNSNDTKKIQIQLANENSDSNSNWDPVPPLAPLSGGNMVRSLIISAPPSICGTDDSNSSSSNLTPTTICTNMSSKPAATTTPNSLLSTDDDSSKDSVKSSQIVTSNQMLVDLLDKKSFDPPVSVGIKRRLECDENASSPSDESCKRIAIDGTSSPNPVASKNAANLYADLAASILEDEDDLEEMPLPVVQKPPPQQQIISVPLNMQRQIQVVNSNQTPVIIQKQQQVVSQQSNSGNTPQYVLATNPQGQTYLLAPQSQQHPPPQAVVVTQTNNQQGGAPTKTIIILQQQSVPQQNSVQMQVPVGAPQKNPNPVNIVKAGASPPPILQTSFQGNIPATIKFHQAPSVMSSTPPIQGNIVSSSTTPIGKPIKVNDLENNSAVSSPKIPQKNVIVHTIKPSPPVVSPPPQLVKTNPPPASTSAPVPTSTTVVKASFTPPNLLHNNTENVTAQPTMSTSTPMTPATIPTPISATTVQTTTSNPTVPCPTLVTPKPPTTEKPAEDEVDINWLWICDWKNCPRKKFRSLKDVYKHACTVHCPDNLDPAAEIFCQWGVGSSSCSTSSASTNGPGGQQQVQSLCDGVPRKRFSLMTHILDRHCTNDSFHAAVQRRLSSGIETPTGQPVTIIKTASSTTTTPSSSLLQHEASGTASPTLSISSNSSGALATAMHAIKRYSSDFQNPKELMPMNNFAFPFQDENEGPVTKSIRLTAALILRNLVTHTTSAKKLMRRFEPHLASVALSNVESSGTVSQILFELNN
ncbi:ARID2 family protein [Megaselia abdita]